MTSVDHPDFLPPAHAIEAGPPPAAARWLLWLIPAIFVTAVAWAAVGRSDIVSVAPGRLIPSGYSKAVRTAIAGQVRAVHVHEGQRVSRGQRLIELVADSAEAEVHRLAGQVTETLSRVRRVAWLRALAAQGATPTVSVLVGDEPPLVSQRWLEHVEQYRLLVEERSQVIARRDALAARVDKSQAMLPLLASVLSDQRELAGQQLLAMHRVLETEMRHIELRHDLEAQRAELAATEADIAHAGLRLRIAVQRFARALAEELDEQLGQLASLSREREKAHARVRASRIDAPVDGIVQHLSVHHVGAVVGPEQPLFYVVPDDGHLEVEAILRNRDVGHVQVGQAARIKLDTFPFTRYGTLEGTVSAVSAETLPDPKAESSYRLRVRLASDELAIDGRRVSLVPGMAATVEIRTGQRRLIEYLLGPLMRVADESFVER
jgi:hemolysin D